MLILDQNIPFRRWSVQSTPDTLATILYDDLARCTAKCIGAGINRVGQVVVHSVVERQLPDDAAPLSTVGFVGCG